MTGGPDGMAFTFATWLFACTAALLLVFAVYFACIRTGPIRYSRGAAVFVWLLLCGLCVYVSYTAWSDGFGVGCGERHGGFCGHPPMRRCR